MNINRRSEQLKTDKARLSSQVEKTRKHLEAVTEETKATGTGLTPTIIPRDIRKPISLIRQGSATNTLTKIKANTEGNTVIDKITQEATITRGDMAVTFPTFTDANGLRTSTYQLLDALTQVFTLNGAKSPNVTLLLSDYMEKRKLKNRKEARKQVKGDLETLFNARISYTEKRKNQREEAFKDIRLIGSKGINRAGEITVTFTLDFFNIMSNYPVMYYPPQLWELSGNRNPNSYYLLRKIAEHTNMNVGKKNENIISVKTLLESTSYIPSYEEVMQKDKHLSKRIIQPFERDMDVLEPTLSWEYCHHNGEPLTDEEIRNFDYDIFKTLLVMIHWKDYPDQTARLSRKEERIKKAKRRRTSKKKAE